MSRWPRLAWAGVKMGKKHQPEAVRRAWRIEERAIVNARPCSGGRRASWMGFEHAHARGRRRGELAWRSLWARHQFAAAVGTRPAGQARLGAVAAEGALERADHSVSGVRGKVLAAALAVGAQFEHRLSRLLPLDLQDLERTCPFGSRHLAGVPLQLADQGAGDGR